jgi:hypothetical protein
MILAHLIGNPRQHLPTTEFGRQGRSPEYVQIARKALTLSRVEAAKHSEKVVPFMFAVSHCTSTRRRYSTVYSGRVETAAWPSAGSPESIDMNNLFRPKEHTRGDLQRKQQVNIPCRASQ